MTLALKYRPTQFQDLVGQRSVSQTLSYALDQKKISNAYLFSGLRGSGKTSSARIFARALQCENGPTSTPCEICDNCKASLEGRHIDIIELDAASNRKIDDIRDLIEQTKYKPSFGRYKIFIIDEVHMLTKEAFNALLKTLEEPPEFVKFILATTDPLLLPATILSRTQHFRFKKIPHKSVIEHIASILKKEDVPFELEALDIIARSGSGSLRDTITILEQAIIFGNNQIKIQSVTEMLGIIDPQIFEQFFDAILQKNSSLSQGILETMQEYEAEMIIDEMMLFLKNKALQKNLNPTFLNRFFNILAQSKTLLSLNTDGEFVLMLLMLKMQEAIKLREIHSLIGELENHPQTFSLQTPQSPVQTLPPTPISNDPAPKEDSEKTLFENLINALYDRNHHLGECFEKSIRFIDFKEKTLTLTNPSSSEEEKSFLREQYPLIKTFINQIFGQDTQVIFQQMQSTQKIHQNQKLHQNQGIHQSQEIHQNQKTQAQNIQPIQTDPQKEANDQRDSQDFQSQNNPFLQDELKPFQTPQNQENINPQSTDSQNINAENINPQNTDIKNTDIKATNTENTNAGIIRASQNANTESTDTKSTDTKIANTESTDTEITNQKALNQIPLEIPQQNTHQNEQNIQQNEQDTQQDLTQNILEQKSPKSPATQTPQSIAESHLENTPTTTPQENASPSFAFKHQRFLSNLKKHLQADLSTAKKI